MSVWSIMSAKLWLQELSSASRAMEKTIAEVKDAAEAAASAQEKRLVSALESAEAQRKEETIAMQIAFSKELQNHAASEALKAEHQNLLQVRLCFSPHARLCDT